MNVRDRQLGELLRFGVVGGSAVATDFIVYFALLSAFPALGPAVAKALSFVAGAVLAFMLNRSFVFRARETSAKRQVVPFVLLYLLSLSLNGAINALLLRFGVAKPVAWLFATGTSTVSNFIGMKFVVFHKRSKKSARSHAE